jgi:hypothetical protein
LIYVAPSLTQSNRYQLRCFDLVSLKEFSDMRQRTHVAIRKKLGEN